MNTESSKTSEAHILILKLAYKIDLRRAEKIIALSNLSIYYTWKNIKDSYNNNKSKITAPTLNNKFELPDGYRFLSFAKNMGKNSSNKYGQKLLDSAKKSATNAIKTASKRAIQKTAQATGDLIGNKIADQIISVSKKSSTELHSKDDDAYSEIEVPKKGYMSPEERQQIIDELRLVQQYNNGISKSRKFARQHIKSTI